MFSMCDHLSLLFWGKAYYSKECILKYNNHHMMNLGEKRERGEGTERERERAHNSLPLAPLVSSGGTIIGTHLIFSV